jgi:hypothetical protein
MTDTQILEWLCDNLEFDGYGYWLPEICVKSMDFDELCLVSPPTITEFRTLLIEWIHMKV